MQSQVRFNTVPEKVPEKVWEALVQPGHPEASRRRSGRLWCRARLGSGESSGEGLGGFGAELVRGFGAKPGQVPQGSGRLFGAEPG